MSGAPQDDRYQRYLLGELDAAARDALEDEYFSSDEAWAALKEAELDAFDAYLEGELSGAQRAHFEAQQLRTDSGRQRLRFARALAQRAERDQPSPRARGARLGTWLWGTAAALAFALSGTYLTDLRNELRQARTERTALQDSAAGQQRQVLAQGRELSRVQDELIRLRARAEHLEQLLAAATQSAARVVALVLDAGLTRDAGPLPRLVLRPGSSSVRLTLLLQGPLATTCRASLQTPEGRELWARAGLRPRPSGGAVVITLPASTLAPGHYAVVLSREGKDAAAGSLGTYVFQAVRAANPAATPAP